MNQNPLVTVICLCFNHQNYVIETIDSVLKQTYSNIEIIIVDDCSLDKSVQEITHFIKDKPEIRFIKNKSNLGINKTFNKAAKFAKGSFLIDLACDDILLPNCVEKQIEAFLKADLKNTAIVFGNSENIDSNGKYLSDYFKTNTNKSVIDQGLFQTDLIRVLKGGLSINSVSAMMNKKIFDELGGYDESLSFEDLDYWLRSLKLHKIIFIDEILTQKRDLKSSLGSQFLKKNKTSNALNQSLNKIYSKNIREHKRDKNILRAILKRIHYSLIHAAKNKDFRFIFCYGLQKARVHYYLLLAK